MTKKKSVSYLKVTEDTSELVYDDGSTTAFKEGKPNQAAIARLANIKAGFTTGFLAKSLEESKKFNMQSSELRITDSSPYSNINTKNGSTPSLR
jgi:uncharacterized protein YwgA